MKRILLALCLGGLSGCPNPVRTVDAGALLPDAGRATADAGAGDTTPPPDAGFTPPESIVVHVTLDGVPTAGVRVQQGGRLAHQLTEASGSALVALDPTVLGDLGVVASHPEARQGFAAVGPAGPAELTIDLLRYDTSDNEEYIFADPGEPSRRDNTMICSHCHQVLGDLWFDSAHRQSASNPKVHDLYQGVRHDLDDPQLCALGGGDWRTARLPGGGSGGRCFIGGGVLSSINLGCEEGPCPEPAQSGACADCHAPAIDGAIGGRDLLHAAGRAYDYGVHCDVCHKVDDIDESAPAGVAGRLKMTRSSEPGDFTLGRFLPLTFGPSHDSPNVRMGSVQRDHFRDGKLCVGCHEYRQPGLVGGVDPERFSDRKIPVQTTYSEWKEGIFGDVVACNGCHMPPLANTLNSANLERFLPAAEVGLQAGWPRPPGAVRSHAFVGPRSEASQMLELAAGLRISKQVTGGLLTAQVTTTNVSCGHALPTGEPARHLLLQVEAHCADQDQPATGGFALPAVAGARAEKAAGSNWLHWPTAQVGDRIRVVRTPAAFRDYDGVPPFDQAGGWSVERRGWAVEEVVGEVIVDAVHSGQVETRPALPSGDRAYLLRDDDAAGSPGVLFARVLTGADGQPMVPHHLAVDVQMDNRLKPQQSFTSSHEFSVACADPKVTARLWYRSFPIAQRQRYGWDAPDRLMVEARR